MTKERDYSLDWLKALAIFTVCQVHYMHFNHSAVDNLIAILSCLGVPLFFMVNGALLLNHELDVKRHYKKTAKVFGLCVLWKFITVLVLSVIWKVSILQNGFGTFINYLIGQNGLEGFEVGHFWYLYALVGIYTIYPLIKIAWDTEEGRLALRYVTVIIGIFTMGFSTVNLVQSVLAYKLNYNFQFSVYNANSFYIFGTYGYCILWFVLGGFIYEKVKEYRKSEISSKNYGWIVTFLFGWGLLFGMNRFQNIVGDAQCIVIDGYYCIPTLMMCCSIFYGFGIGLNKIQNSLVIAISRNTWGIYMLHMIVGTVFLKVQWRYQFECGIPLNTVKSIWMIAASMAVILVMKKIPVLNKLITF